MYTYNTHTFIHTHIHNTVIPPPASLAEIDLPLCPRPAVIMGLSDRPAMIAQGKWDGGGSRRMMEKSFLSPMERSIILTLREREREEERRAALDDFLGKQIYSL